MLNSVFSVSILLTCGTMVAVDGQTAPIKNVTYGPDPFQIMDIYLPFNPATNVSKVILVIHGGAWGAGYKEEMDRFIPHLLIDFPTYLIANMDYRLGTHESPGFPKQLEDIELALSYLQQTFSHTVTFALYGGSAGALNAMLYGYSYSTANQRNVKAIVSLVGPTDLNDPSYTQNPAYDGLFFDLVGPCTYSECPDLYNVTSPITFAKTTSQPTIGFYGNFDLLVPSTQMPLLQDKLTELGVPNSFTMYAGGHEWNWSEIDKLDMQERITQFLNMVW